ncbi:MAG: peptide chain release factor N(5)-glutamine methyltransferase [Ruminococcus sp.]|nr:peptide chain release factor N(5)-glutamine methyltransferase [Ruminococcus sp.]
MTVPALHDEILGILTRANIPYAKGETLEIMIAAAHLRHTIELHERHAYVSDEDCEKALNMAKRRAKGEPLQYVLGHWFFMGREYKVGEGVLIPRDDTEVLVGEAITLARAFPSPSIVDLCSGSGIIAITLAKELHNATIYAVEKSEQAFRYLTENIALHQADVKAICADLADCVSEFEDGSLDMIVSNPPYIRTDELPTLQSEVQYEPRLALDGGADGCDLYRLIVDLWTRKLKKGGCIAFEIGEGQFETIRDLLSEYGYTDIVGTPDIQGTIRAVTARKR